MQLLLALWVAAAMVDHRLPSQIQWVLRAIMMMCHLEALEVA